MAKEFIIGNEVVVRAALAAGAEMMCGYPITPTTEIMSYWTKVSDKDKTDNIKFLQTEDEMAAGFAMIGAILSGTKAFTATAGPGNILMQDAFAMAEAMRIPTVAIIMQRGGPSTGTVIYSQQEVILTTHGGNGEGFRIVFSPSNLQELYNLVLNAFDVAWRYRFPTFVLGDGYLGKMQGAVDIDCHNKIPLNPPFPKGEGKNVRPYLLQDKSLKDIKKFMPKGSYLISKREGMDSKEMKEFVCLRNCYNTEEELNAANECSRKDFEAMAPKVIQYEEFNCVKPKTLVIAHGMVGAAVKSAIISSEMKKVGLFRPISLSPFPKANLIVMAKRAKKIIIIESAINQLGMLVKDALYGLKVPIEGHFKSAEGFTPQEIIDILK